MDYAACIGCGACVAACPNASAHLFVGAKVAQLALLPQGQPERNSRVDAMTAVADADFGACSDVGACRDACPASVPLDAIARLNHERLRSIWRRGR
jgi:succinate dehydrogenase / fumarate reductase iron-sulfur subunit